VVCGLVFVAGAAFWCTFCAPSQPPASALARALEHIDAANYDAAERMLAAAAKDDTIAHWVTLTKALVHEKAAKTGQAVNLYQKIAPDSAAYPDAQLALLRLGGVPSTPGETASAFGEAASKLEVLIRQAKRHDLAAELAYLKASAAEAQGDFSFASTLYRQIRQDHTGAAPAILARKACDRMRDANIPAAKQSSVADQIAEAQLLLKEKDLAAALSAIQQAKSQVSEETPAYFQAMLVEEKILRAAERRLEADHVLALVSAGGAIGTGDQALHAIIKAAWNVNDYPRALELIESFARRFPASELFDSVLYMKARILEEQELTADAKAVYQQLSEQARVAADRIRAERHLGWLYLRKSDYFHAARSFSRAAGLAAELLAQNRGALSAGGSTAAFASMRDALEEKHHASFWRAYSLAQTKEQNSAGPQKGARSAGELSAELMQEQPYGYYALLAQHKGLLAPQSDGALPQGTSMARPEECLAQIAEPLSASLENLHAAGLDDHTGHEIEWHFAQSAQEQLSYVRRMLTRAQLYERFSRIRKGIALSNELLQPAQWTPAAVEELESCRPYILAISYPRPYAALFEKSAAEHRLPPALLYAVARTESYFDAQARSHKNALGLMQLLPETAEAEGLKPGDDLMVPEINIHLGAKHLARLIAAKGSIEHALAAYNAGSAAAERWKTRFPGISTEMWTELIGYPETKNYVKKVLQAQYIYESQLAGQNSKQLSSTQ